MHTKHKKFHIIRNMHVYNIHTLQYIIVIPSITVKKLSRNHHIVELDAHTIGNKAIYAPNRA